MRWSVVVAWTWGLASSAGCEREPAMGRIDATIEPDVRASDAGADASLVDALEPADPACAGPSPACTTPPTTVLAASIIDDTWVSGMVRVGDTLYIATSDVANTGSPEISAARITMVDLPTGTQTTLLPSTVSYALSATHDAVYAAEYRSGGAIWQLVPGSAPVALVSNLPRPGAVTADATHIYWSEDVDAATDVVKRRLIAGGAIEHVMDCDRVWALSVDDAYVYCAGGSQVLRVPKAGSALQTIGDLPNLTTGMRQCGPALYLTHAGQELITRVPLPGGPAATFTTVATDAVLDSFVGIAASQQHFYVSSFNTGIHRVDRTTLTATNIVSGVSATLDPVVWSGQLLFWDRELGVRRCVD